MSKLIIIILFVVSLNLYAEKNRTWPNPIRLVDLPTAGGYGKGSYEALLLAYPGGGTFVGVGIGLNEIFSMGVSYRAGGVIGSGDPDWGEWPEVFVKAQLLPEKGMTPAVSLGYDSNGFDLLGQGGYTGNRHYPNNFYGIVSKSFKLIGNNAIHGGLIYVLQEGKKGISPSFGLEKEIGAFLFTTEYHFAVNEDKPENNKDGYWNMEFGILLSPSASLSIEFRNLLEANNKPWNRSLQLSYRGKF
ncbi:MAG: hypothetical protein JXA60_04640 [Candidatus Coatesbacteria bacterium]|nr:hypothetical protein [Candidatus Coatesbacteria bacterium]